MRVKVDKLLGKVREKDIIPQLDADPTNPKAQDAWILKTGGSSGVEGSPIGLLLPLTYVSASTTYEFSYRTKEGTTIRIVLS